jgi:hypothetical protein
MAVQINYAGIHTSRRTTQRLVLLVVLLATTIELTAFGRVLPKFRSILDLKFVYEDSSEAEDSLEAKDSGYASLDYDLSVVITSSLIPTHPNIDIISGTIASLSRLEGLPHDTPIYITVDGLPTHARTVQEQERLDSDHQRRSEYIRRMQSSSFAPFTNIEVVAMDQPRHITGSVNEAMKHISNQTRYRYKPDNHFIYLLQHDLYFIQSIPHPQLISGVRESPDQLRNIRFRYNKGRGNQDGPGQDTARFPRCRDIENGNVFERQGLQFFATARWSDNNQLSTLEYYQRMIVHIMEVKGRLSLPMEWVMVGSAETNCTVWGQAVLGNRTTRLAYLGHADGRMTQTMPENVTVW